MSASTGGAAPDRGERRTVLQDGRAKAYRPLSVEKRVAAYRAGIAAYRGGDFFEAHELLEPAWMGTDEPIERALHQGLIKLAAGFVHAVRGNPAGVRRTSSARVSGWLPPRPGAPPAESPAAGSVGSTSAV